MQQLTDLADLAVLLPLALCVAGWLWSGGWTRGVWLWLAGLMAVLAIMLIAKLALLGCAIPGAALVSPSGHTAAAAYVYGGMAALVWRMRTAMATASAAAIAIVFGLSRIAVHAHSLAEIVFGGAVGVAAVAGLILASGGVAAGLRPLRLAFCAVPLIIVLHGVRLNMEPRLRVAASWMGLCI
jgi:membrane-associated phospholipid phosphatase